MLSDKDLNKLRTPLHLNYIQDNIIKLNKEQTLHILNQYVEKGILKKEKEYYSWK